MITNKAKKWSIFLFLGVMMVSGILFFAAKTDANPVVVRVPKLQMELGQIDPVPQPISPEIEVEKAK